MLEQRSFPSQASRNAFLFLLIFSTAALSARAQSAPQAVSPSSSGTQAPSKASATSSRSATAPDAEKDLTQSIIDASRAASPELHADALLLLVESRRVDDHNLQLALLKEAWETAPKATRPMARKMGINGVIANSNAGMEMFASMIDLDQLSLTTRTIADVAKLNPSLARAWLNELRPPAVKPAECTQAMIDNPRAYYVLLAQLAKDKSANLKDGKDTSEEMLEPAISRLQTHLQAALALRLLQDANLTAAQRELLAQIFTGQLAKLRGDERGFASLMLNWSAKDWSQSLQQLIASIDPGTGQSLLLAFRTYLVENARAGGCGANWVQRRDKQGNPVLPSALATFNEQLGRDLARTGMEPIQPAEIANSVPEAKPEVQLFGEGAQMKDFAKELAALKWTDGNTVRSAEELRSSAWEAQATAFLIHLDAWQADPFHSDEVMFQKLMYYGAIIGLAPQELRWTATESALSLIENSSLENEDPAYNLFQVHVLRQNVTNQVSGDGFAALNGRHFTKRMINSKSPALHLFGLLDEAKLNPFQLDSNSR